MKQNECAICGKKHDLLTLEIPNEDFEGDPIITIRHVCGKCWETIAEIARRVFEAKIEI